jgi:hypothetical protein
MKVEVVVLPVSDVDKAEDSCQALGWRRDAGFAISEAASAQGPST